VEKEIMGGKKSGNNGNLIPPVSRETMRILASGKNDIEVPDYP
jgi:hypothetical protein